MNVHDQTPTESHDGCNADKLHVFNCIANGLQTAYTTTSGA